MPDQPEAPTPKTEPPVQPSDEKPSMPDPAPETEPRPEPIRHPHRFQGSTPPQRDTTILSEDE